MYPTLGVMGSLFFSRSSVAVVSCGAMALFFLPELVCPTNVSPYFYLDSLSVPFVLLALWLLPLIVMADSSYFRVLVGLVGLLVLAFAASNFLWFYVAFEAALIPTAYLVLMGTSQPERMQAASYLMVYTVAGSMPLLASLVGCYFRNGHLSLYLPSWEFPVGQWGSFWAACLLFAFLVKMPVWGFHLWLPKAHVEAPTVGSMLLAGGLLKLGSYGLLRAFELWPGLASFSSFWVGLSLWGSVLAGVVCLRLTDLKMLVAYSSVTHMGLLVASAFSVSDTSRTGVIMMSFAHGLAASALFSLVGVIYSFSQTRSLYLVRGIGSFAPLLGAAWFLSLAANLGCPPTLNLCGELCLVSSLTAFSVVAVPVVALGLFLSGAYGLHLYGSTQHGPTPLSLGPCVSLSHREMLMVTGHLLPLVSVFSLGSFLVSGF